jgi:3-dehydrosphinganine reductase
MELDPFNVKVSIIFPADTDTPGLENENKRKPEITRLISATSGVMKPEAVAALLVSGLEEGRFLVPVNFDGWILNLLTVGMAVTGLSVLVELLVWPLLRLVGVAHTLYFSYLVKKHVST